MISRMMKILATAACGLGIATGALADGGGQRLITIGGSITEIVHELKAEGRLVGVDSTSMYPASARSFPNVGYVRQLSAEPILALAPDLILAEADAGPPAAVDQLKSAGVGFRMIPEEHSIEGVIRKIGLVADALGMVEQGEELSSRVQARYDAVRARVAGIKDRPRVMFVLSAGKGAPLAAGTGTSAEAIIEMAGGANAIDGFQAYRPLTPEAGVAAQPDIVLVTERTLKLLGGKEALALLPGIQGTPAAENGALFAMDGLLLLGFGPRVPEAVEQLAAILHPGS